MRIPFPKSIPLRPALIFLALVLFIQLLEDTDPVFAVLMLIAQLAAVEAFNLMGGMTHMAGAFSLFAILPTVTVPELAHLLLGQPGDFNLEHPLMTAGVCAVFFTCVMSAALLVSIARPAQPLLERFSFSILELRIISALACVLAAGIGFTVLTHGGPPENGTLLAALNRFSGMFIVMSIMLATYAGLMATKGRSAMSFYIVFVLFVAEMAAIMTASKERMLTPVFCWLVVVAACRYRFSRGLGVLVLLGLGFLVWSFVYPYSQRARFQVGNAPTISDKVSVIIQFIKDRSSFPDTTPNFEEASAFGTASSQVNIVARFSLLQSIDMLIGADLKSGYTSIDRYAPILVTMVPHSLWPDRPEVITSNELGYKAGFAVGEDDTTTGLEIGAPANFFDLGGWTALVVYTIICFALFFFVTVRVVGTTAAGAWALVPIGMEAHMAGGASLASIFLTVFMFLSTLGFAIAVLKTVGYIFQTLISRPISSGA